MITSQQALKLVQQILDYWAENDPFTREHTFINKEGDIEVHSVNLSGHCISALMNEFGHVHVSTSLQFPDHIRMVCSL